MAHPRHRHRHRHPLASRSKESASNHTTYQPSLLTLPQTIAIAIGATLISLILVFGLVYYTKHKRSGRLATSPTLTRVRTTEQATVFDEKDVPVRAGVSHVKRQPRTNRLSRFVTPRPSLEDTLRESEIKPEDMDLATIVTLRAGMNSLSRRGHKTHQGSESTFATATTDSLFLHARPPSSMTTFSTVSSMSEDAELEELEHYEVRRARAQSIEFRRGVLVSSMMALPPKEDERSINLSVPAVMISTPFEEGHFLPSLPTISTLDHRLLYVQTPDGLIATLHTSPTVSSATSTISIDLDDFPLPPTNMLASHVYYASDDEVGPLYNVTIT